MKTLLARFANDDSGVTAVEYGLIAALIGIAIIAAMTSLGGQLSSTFTAISDTLSTANAKANTTTGK
jgi:pilus assembly protein Flp/PilA